jgi:hypothetical protein
MTQLTAEQIKNLRSQAAHALKADGFTRPMTFLAMAHPDTLKDIITNGVKAQIIKDSWEQDSPEPHPDYQDPREEAPTSSAPTATSDTTPATPYENGDTGAELIALLRKATMNREEIREYVKQLLATMGGGGVVEHKFQVGKQEPVTLKVVHRLFPDLLFSLSRGWPTFLWGEASGGKTTAVQMAAKVLKLDFAGISLSQSSPSSLLTGYMDARGEYVNTAFMKLYESGGVFLIDEIESDAPAFLTQFNSAIENGFVLRPDGETVTMHEDFFVVATGNTAGLGGTSQYVNRRPLDAATRDRFWFIEWGIDQHLEDQLLGLPTKAQTPRNLWRDKALTGDELQSKVEAWTGWVRAVRKFTTENDLRLLPTMRAAKKGAEALAVSHYSLSEIAEMALFRGAAESTKTQVLQQHPLPRF